MDSTLTRGSGGEFEVTLDGRLVFSKKQAGRSPTAADIVRLVRPA